MNLLRAISNLLRFDRTNWKALTLCFFAAAVFWMFNALNKSYSTNVSFPLQFEFDNTKYVAVEPLPATITLNVSGNGWELFRKSYGLKAQNISMPLERPSDVHKLVASSLSPMVASQIGTLQMNYVVTDTLRLKIEPKITRKIKLYASLDNASFKGKYGRISPVVILPDSVKLEGPKSLIKSLPDSIILMLNASRIDGNFKESVEVVVGNNELINRNPPVAEIKFDVGLKEEVTYRVKLKMPKAPWATELDRDSVTCVFSIAEKDHQRFVEDAPGLSASFKLGEIPKGKTRSFYPNVMGVPSYAELLHVDSVIVKKY